MKCEGSGGGMGGPVVYCMPIGTVGLSPKLILPKI